MSRKGNHLDKSTSQIICPYLGLIDDPQSVFNFPSGGNFCHRSNLPLTVRIERQISFCLQNAFSTCPIYQSNPVSPFLMRFREIFKKSRKANLLVRRLVAIIILVMAAFGFILIPQIQNPTGATNVAILKFSDQTNGLLSHQDGITPFLENTQAGGTKISGGHELSATATMCFSPSRWSRYIVMPVDTLESLSLTYGVTVAQLQRANCLGNRRSLISGQILFVPGIGMTPKISKTFTPTPTRTLVPYIPLNLSPTSAPDSVRPAATNTPQATTAPIPSPTSVPSTIMPTTPPPPTLPPQPTA